MRGRSGSFECFRSCSQEPVGSRSNLPSATHRFHGNGEAMIPPGQCDRPNRRGITVVQKPKMPAELKRRHRYNLISSCASAREGQGMLAHTDNLHNHRSLRKAEAEPRSCSNAPGSLCVYRMFVCRTSSVRTGVHVPPIPRENWTLLTYDILSGCHRQGAGWPSRLWVPRA